MPDRELVAKSGSSLDSSQGARAVLVNRTRRLVRERAELLRSRQNRSRTLFVPLAICAALCVIMALAIWSLLDQYGEAYERAPIGIPDASNQFLVILLWFLPLSMALVALALLRRTRADRETSR